MAGPHAILLLMCVMAVCVAMRHDDSVFALMYVNRFDACQNRLAKSEIKSRQRYIVP